MMTENECQMLKEVKDCIFRRRKFGPLFLVWPTVHKAEGLYYSGKATVEYKKSLEKLARKVGK